MKSVEERLALLEKSNRRLRLGMIVVLSAGAAPYFLAATHVVDVFQATEIRAQRIDLLNGAEVVGTIKAWVPDSSWAKTHGPGIGFYGANGQLNVSFPQGGNGGDVHLYSKAGTSVGTWYAGATAGTFALTSAVGQGGTTLAVDSAGGYLHTFSSNGKVATYLGAETEGDGGLLSIADKNGRRRIYLGPVVGMDRRTIAIEDSAGRDMALLSADGTGGWLRARAAGSSDDGYIGVDKSGHVMVALTDSADHHYAEMGDDGSASYLNLLRGETRYISLAAKTTESWLSFNNSAGKEVAELGARNFSDENGRGSGKLWLWDETGSKTISLASENGLGGELEISNAAGKSVLWLGPYPHSDTNELYLGGRVIVRNRNGDAVGYIDGYYSRGRFCGLAPAATTCAWNSPMTGN